MDTEQVLITALKQRDPDALASLFTQYSHKIYRLALSVLHDEQQADGVVQNTFLALIEHIDRFEGHSSIGTWLYRVGYNEAVGRVRRGRPDIPLDDDAKDSDLMPGSLINWQDVPEEIICGQEASEQMQHAIQRLTPSLRAVFTLRDVEELSTHDTAQILGISEAAVKVRLHRARLILREQLAEYFQDRVRGLS